MSFKAFRWWFFRWTKLLTAWGFLIGGTPVAFSNIVLIIGATVSDSREPSAVLWALTALSVVIPIVGVLMLRDPVYYPDYVGGVMGYRNREAFEKAQQRVLKAKRGIQE